MGLDPRYSRSASATPASSPIQIHALDTAVPSNSPTRATRSPAAGGPGRQRVRAGRSFVVDPRGAAAVPLRRDLVVPFDRTRPAASSRNATDFVEVPDCESGSTRASESSSTRVAASSRRVFPWSVVSPLCGRSSSVVSPRSYGGTSCSSTASWFFRPRRGCRCRWLVWTARVG